MFNLNNVKFLIGRGTLYVQKYSPEILTAVGIVGGATTVVLASKATLKVQPVLNDLRADTMAVNSIHDMYENEGRKADTSRGRELTHYYTKHGLKIVKIYSPSVTMGLLSATSILGAHGIMRRRNMALVALAKSLESTLNEFKQRVDLELGTERANEMLSGIETETTKDKDGKKETRKVVDSQNPAIYRVLYDSRSANWDTNMDYNRTFLGAQEKYANDRLVARGHLFLNEVYEALGLPHTPEGAVTGWVYDPDDDTIDNFVDFGINAVVDAQNPEGLKIGRDEYFLLDFNVDGVMFDKIR